MLSRQSTVEWLLIQKIIAFDGECATRAGTTLVSVDPCTQHRQGVRKRRANNISLPRHCWSQQKFRDFAASKLANHYIKCSKITASTSERVNNIYLSGSDVVGYRHPPRGAS